MKARKALIVFGLVSCVGFGTAGASERVFPTGTPTWAPVQPTPTPKPLTPVQREAEDLGKNLSTIDVAVWTTVREGWQDGDACLKSVDEQLEAATPKVLDWMKATKVINCTLEEGTGRRTVHLTSDEAKESFVKGYHRAMTELRALKREFRQDPEALKFLTVVRSRQRHWQEGLCVQLEKVRPPIPLPEPKPRKTVEDPRTNS